jgi:deoxyribose-phosphate aldolase
MIPINQTIEHTYLKPDFTDHHVYRLIEEAEQYNFKGICLPPFWVKKAAREIGKRQIALITVAGFPLGYNMTETKLEEIRLALKDGATEIDVVMNISAFKAEMDWVKIEIAKCSKLVHDAEKILKVIIETALLSDKEIISACKICAEAGADFVKTSTGFAAYGATENHVKLMRKSLPEDVKIKASGGISDLITAQKLLAAGADTIGSSSSVKIMEELTKS